LTATTTQANELLIGALGFEDKGVNFTPGGGYSALPQSVTTSGPNADNVTMQPEYRIVSSTGQYKADGSDNKNALWAAAIVTYKLAVPSVVSINRADPNPANAGAVHFTVTFSENVFDVVAGDFALGTTGLTGASITGVSGSGATYPVTVNTGTVDTSVTTH